MTGWRGVTRQMLRRPVAVASLAWLLLVVIASAVPVTITRTDPLAQDLSRALAGPSWRHPLGTDMLGRDLLSRLVHGAAPSLLGAGLAVLVAVLVGVSLGLVAGFYGGLADAAVARVADILFALPGIVILLVVIAVMPTRVTLAMGVFGVMIAPGLVRIVRGATLAVRTEPYVAAARIAGLTRRQILRRHVLPRLGSLVIVQAALIAALSVVLQSGLGYLGFGPQPPQPSWGGLLQDAVNVIGRDPWALVPPGVAIGVTALALALLGDVVRDATTARWSSAKLARPGRRRAALAGPPHQDSGGMAPPPGEPALLSVRGLAVAIPTPAGETVVVDDVSFDVLTGEILGLLGESGCGKTVSALSILGLVPGNGRVVAGRCVFEGRDLAGLSRTEWDRVRGRSIGFVAQEATAGLDPMFRIGALLAEAVRRHSGVSRAVARVRAVELLRQVRLPAPQTVALQYPHQVSGGMAQRVAIALALAGDPKLLIADEPTTALDVTVQAEILDLLRAIGRERGMAVLIVTHDWGVVADVCDRVVVMYAGQVAETCAVERVFSAPLHPYTEALLQANPELATGGGRLPAIGGQVPEPGAWPAGCRFAPRCEYAAPACQAPVKLVQPDAGHEVRCVRVQGRPAPAVSR